MVLLYFNGASPIKVQYAVSGDAQQGGCLLVLAALCRYPAVLRQVTAVWTTLHHRYAPGPAQHQWHVGLLVLMAVVWHQGHLSAAVPWHGSLPLSRNWQQPKCTQRSSSKRCRSSGCSNRSMVQLSKPNTGNIWQEWGRMYQLQAGEADTQGTASEC